MEELILITYLNNFIFCPISIYYHRLYGTFEKKLYYSKYQFNGLNVHKSIDNKYYSTKKNILQGIDVYSNKYNLYGKIDIYDIDKKVLIERKNKVNKIYDGFVFQVYAQYYSLIEMGFPVEKIKIYSMSDNKNYNIPIPSKDKKMDDKFKELINDINKFNIENFTQTNIEKCNKCIYSTICDRSLKC